MQLLLQKEIFPASALLPGVFHRRAHDVPEDASVLPQECPSSHEVPGQGLAMASPAGLHLPWCVGTLWHTAILNTASFTLHLSVIPADLPPRGRFCALWHSRSRPTLGKVSTVVAASDATAGTVPLPKCCMQRFSTLPDKSPST